MNTKAQNLKEKIEEAQKTIEESLKLLTPEFKRDIKDIFVRYPDLDYVSFYVNNHDFNDGDPTEFNVSYDYDFRISVGGEEFDYDYSDKKNKGLPKNVIGKEFGQLMQDYDLGNFHEEYYQNTDGDERLIFSREDVEKF